ncbi:hypothetical protein Tco_1546328 [Tanacetum coccineum]
MAIFVVSISLDSSEEIVGTSTARVILFGTIPTVIPATVPIVDPPVVHDETPLIPIETLTIPPIFSTLPHTSLFLYTDSYYGNTSERPPSQDPYEDESEEEAESEDKGTIEIRVDRVSEPVVSDDVYESASDDMSKSADERGLDALVQELHDHLVEIPVRRIRVIETVQRDKGHMMLAASQQSAVMVDRIGVLERDNMRLRGMLCVERERVNSLRRHMSYTQEELRQIRVSRYYDRAEFRRLETFAMRHLGYRP